MDPTPYFIMGTMFGCAATLLIQFYGRRKVAKATAQIVQVEVAPSEDSLIAQELRERVKVLEAIITDKPRLLADQIEMLR